MERIIAFCGIECTKCPALIAKKENNHELRKKTAEEWSKQYNIAVEANSVNCDGCVIPGGVHIGHCQVCEIRKCGLEKNVKNCAYCADYACEKLENFLKQVPDAKSNLDHMSKSQHK